MSIAAKTIKKLQAEINRLRAESDILKKALVNIRNLGTGKGAATTAYKALVEAAEAAKEK
jgi:transposase-like protein